MKPNLDALYELAAAQEGYFTTAQAAETGYSPQLLNHHLRAGRFVRSSRGVYRLVNFPPGEYGDLVAIWLWSERQGVFSHETALALHELSDALPSRVHLTLPAAWRKRRLRVPEGVAPAFSDVEQDERAWVGPVPVTSAARSLNDCAEAKVAPDLLSQAVEDGRRRGLYPDALIAPTLAYLEAFE